MSTFLSRRTLLVASFATGAAEVASSDTTPQRVVADPRRGGWLTPRGNSRLTGGQALSGRLRGAPQVVARHRFASLPPALHPFSSTAGKAADRVLHVRDGRARCYALDGALLWESHPRGLNFDRVVASEDMDGDGRVEIVLGAGRPKDPLGAVAVLRAETGELLFRYDLEAMSYWWTVQTGAFLPGVAGKQVVVCEHGYPPDAKNGFVALLDWERPGATPRERWRYDFSEYTSLPSLLTGDVNGDGVPEICVQTHSRLWALDPRSGALVDFAKWDVSPANVRSYGLVRFQDLNGDGREDFFCIGNFAQHHEVLLNRSGKLTRAWAHGWADNVTTRKISTLWAEPPIADVDGDGRLEMVLSMFNAESEPRWMVRVYDAVTGELKARALDRIALQVADLDGDGKAEVLVEHTRDPNRAVTEGLSLLRHRDRGASPWDELWRDPAARVTAPVTARQLTGPKLRDVPQAVPDGNAPLLVRVAAGVRELGWETGTGVILRDWKPPATPRGPDLSRVPARGYPAVTVPLVADLDGDGRNEILHFSGGRATVYRFDRRRGLTPGQEYATDGAPTAADLDGDGRLELVLGQASVSRVPEIRVVRPADGATLWTTTLPPPKQTGVPFGAPLYFVPGRFLGRSASDVYVYAGTPVVRSLVLHGGTGALVWERGEVAAIGRHYAPTKNLAAVYDVDRDGCDDLVFTAPDYYCVASGPTGRDVVAPAFPPNIFRQPSQGLYTLPAVLERKTGEPLVCLVDGHYFQGVMTPRAQPLWHKLPVVGEARSGAEGFLQLRDGTWLMGYGREDGRFACIEVETGQLRWEFDLGASACGITTCDIDGDGNQEFVFGTSHGELFAIRDAGTRGRVIWRQQLDAGISWVAPADVDADGRSELVVGTGAGELLVLDAV